MHCADAFRGEKTAATDGVADVDDGLAKQVIAEFGHEICVFDLARKVPSEETDAVPGQIGRMGQ